MLLFRFNGPTVAAIRDFSWEDMVMSEAGSAGRKPYVSPSIRDFGDLVEVTAQLSGGFSDVPQGSPTGTGCPGGPSCFS
jgi:hypothetical protein